MRFIERRSAPSQSLDVRTNNIVEDALEKFLEQVPKIINAAAKTPLGIIALLILAASTVGVLLFKETSEQTRLLAFAMIIGSFGLFVLAVLKVKAKTDNNDIENREENGKPSDLNITPLSGTSRLLPLAGHEPIVRENEPVVYPKGFRATFNLSHNGNGNETIILHNIGIELLKYVSGLNPKYAYNIVGSKVIGAGTARVHEFSVTLFGDEVGRAYRVINAAKGKYVQAKSSNFFDTDDATVLEFRAKSGDNETVKINVSAVDPGLYELRFVFHYTCGGDDNTFKTESIFVYHED